MDLWSGRGALSPFSYTLIMLIPFSLTRVQWERNVPTNLRNKNYERKMKWKMCDFRSLCRFLCRFLCLFLFAGPVLAILWDQFVVSLFLFINYSVWCGVRFAIMRWWDQSRITTRRRGGTSYYCTILRTAKFCYSAVTFGCTYNSIFYILRVLVHCTINQ